MKPKTLIRYAVAVVVFGALCALAAGEAINTGNIRALRDAIPKLVFEAATRRV